MPEITEPLLVKVKVPERLVLLACVNTTPMPVGMLVTPRVSDPEGPVTFSATVAGAPSCGTTTLELPSEKDNGTVVCVPEGGDAIPPEHPVAGIKPAQAMPRIGLSHGWTKRIGSHGGVAMASIVAGRTEIREPRTEIRGQGLADFPQKHAASEFQSLNMACRPSGVTASTPVRAPLILARRMASVCLVALALDLNHGVCHRKMKGEV